MESQLKTNKLFRLSEKSFINTIKALGPKWIKKYITDYISRKKIEITSKDSFFEMRLQISINKKWFEKAINA